MDFWDLNDASLRDDFPLPGHEALSFMDYNAGYNQIQMALADHKATALCTSKGIFYYKVIPFGLKNMGVTYQRAMQTIFEDILQRNVE